MAENDREAGLNRLLSAMLALNSEIEEVVRRTPDSRDVVSAQVGWRALQIDTRLELNEKFVHAALLDITNLTQVFTSVLMEIINMGKIKTNIGVRLEFHHRDDGWSGTIFKLHDDEGDVDRTIRVRMSLPEFGRFLEYGIQSSQDSALSKLSDTHKATLGELREEIRSGLNNSGFSGPGGSSSR